MKSYTRQIFASLYLIILSSCNQDRQDKVVKTDTTRVLTVTQILAKRPIFKGLVPYELYNSSDTVYIRLVVNSNKLWKVSMVYFNNEINDWKVQTYTGIGKRNKIIGDTILAIQKKDRILNETTDFYMSWSGDNGKSWHKSIWSPQVLYCKSDRRQRLQNYVQLVISNDSVSKYDPSPSLAIMFQWRQNQILRGNRAYDPGLCDVKRILKLIRR